MDYRYFPDPDLLPLVMTQAQIDAVRATMPELQPAMAARFVREYGLSPNVAHALTQSKAFADYFVDCVAAGGEPKLVSNWMTGELAALLNKQGFDIRQSHLAPSQLAQVVIALQNGSINAKGAKELLHAICEKQGLAQDLSIDALIKQMGLEQVSDSGLIKKIIDEVLAGNQKSVDEFKSGKEKAFHSLVGQVMKASKGRANPAQVNEILKTKLNEAGAS